MHGLVVNTYILTAAVVESMQVTATGKALKVTNPTMTMVKSSAFQALRKYAYG